MTRGPLSFRQRDVVRAVKAAQAAGIEVARIELDQRGKIVIVSGEQAAPDYPDFDVNEWDQLNGKHSA
jgi:hypothetical protein